MSPDASDNSVPIGTPNISRGNGMMTVHLLVTPTTAARRGHLELTAGVQNAGNIEGEIQRARRDQRE